MKKFRIVELNRKVYKYRVDQRHWFLFIPYWDNGSYDLSPNYMFEKIEDAEKAILENIVSYDLKKNNENSLREVLVRNDENDEWKLNVLFNKTNDGKYVCIGGDVFNKCIIYCDETKDLYLTSKNCDNNFVV